MWRFAILVSVLLAAPIACSGPAQGPTYRVNGRATASPTCLVVPASPMPGQCDPRPVGEAVLVITDPAGTRITSVTTAADGTFAVSLAEGRYILVPSPVAGVLGTAPPVPFDVSATRPPPALEITYDTGIR
jgi:hypothetical protein